MEDLRSKSCGDRRNHGDGAVAGPTSSGTGTGTGTGSHGMQDLRCYSASYASSTQSQIEMSKKEVKLKKGKSTNGWSLSDPELQRKKRVASYKVYSVEGKVKGSLRKSFRWIKDKYSRVVYGWW